jgi:hypothetical protein
LSNTATDSSPPLRQAQAPGQASPPPPPQDVAMKLQWQASKSKELIDMRDFPRPEKSRESEERLQSAESTTECHHPARHVGLHTPATKLRHGSNQCVQTETHGTLGARHIAATLFHAEKFDQSSRAKQRWICRGHGRPFCLGVGSRVSRTSRQHKPLLTNNWVMSSIRRDIHDIN